LEVFDMYCVGTDISLVSLLFSERETHPQKAPPQPPQCRLGSTSSVFIPQPVEMTYLGDQSVVHRK
jgi:hypothetical protein